MTTPWWVTIVAALIAAVPPTIIALAVWRQSTRNRNDLRAHIGDEGATTETIMVYLENLSEAAGIGGAGRNGPNGEA